MLRKLILAAAGLAGIAMTTLPAAAATDIQCPASQMRKEIVSPLPSGWWQTPLIANLSGTEVMQIGGEPALVCKYGAAGNVQRKAPVGQVCQARPNGFRCQGLIVTPLPAGPVTHSTGPIDLPQTYLADLDSGEVTQFGADIWYRAVNASQKYIQPRNGARISISGPSNRGKAGCSTAHYTDVPAALVEIPVGTYVCVKTSEGRISEFRVNGYNGTTMKIGYTTWK
jgi:hypothetical protein